MSTRPNEFVDETDCSLVFEAIDILSQISPRDLDNCTIAELAQFQYWLLKHQGAIFVKTIGRLGNMELVRAFEDRDRI